MSNPLTLLHLQNKTYDPVVLEQAQDLFEKISKAILSELNYIDYDQPIYAVNRLILSLKGYLFQPNNRIVWNDYSF
jgi:hypothetical protein